MRPESPLIREQFNTRNRVGSAKPRFLSDRGLTKMIEHVINVDAGIKYYYTHHNNNNKRQEEQQQQQQQLLESDFDSINSSSSSSSTTTTTQTHSFRRFFETTAIKEGISPLYVNMLMNHDIGLEKSYFKPTVNDLLEGSDKMPGYIQIMNAVTINEENRLSKQVHQLKEKDDYQKYVIDKKIKEKDEEIVKMRQAMRTAFDMSANQKDNIKELKDSFKGITSSLFEMKMFTIKMDEVDQKKQEMYATKGFVTKEDKEAIKNSIVEDVKQNDPDLWRMLFEKQQQQHQERQRQHLIDLSEFNTFSVKA
jgi:hypothetical protein